MINVRIYKAHFEWETEAVGISFGQNLYMDFHARSDVMTDPIPIISFYWYPPIMNTTDVHKSSLVEVNTDHSTTTDLSRIEEREFKHVLLPRLSVGQAIQDQCVLHLPPSPLILAQWKLKDVALDL